MWHFLSLFCLSIEKTTNAMHNWLELSSITYNCYDTDHDYQCICYMHHVLQYVTLQNNLDTVLTLILRHDPYLFLHQHHGTIHCIFCVDIGNFFIICAVSLFHFGFGSFLYFCLFFVCLIEFVLQLFTI